MDRQQHHRRPLSGNSASAASPEQAPRLDRAPPQNVDAEKSLLGSLMLDNQMLDEVADALTADDFYLDRHRRIYQAIVKLSETGSGSKGIDALTVAEALSRTNELGEAGGSDYLIELYESVPHAAHAKYYAGIVRDKSTQRRLIYACTDILKNAYDQSTETQDLLDQAEQKIFHILQQQEAGAKLEMREILLESFARIEARIENKGVSGIATGFCDLDAKTNGLQPTELVILAARPSMGKTAFILNLAESIADKAQAGVLIFSLEQSRHELSERFLCIRGKLDMHRMRKGELDEDQRDRLLRTASELGNLPLFIDDAPGRSMSQIAAISRRLKRKDDIKVVIIDYLQLIEAEDRRAPREQQIAQITRRLKFLAKELDIPVVALAQLNRGVELREDKRPKLADLRESGAIEQDADIVMFLHRPEMYDATDRPGEADVIVAKHRNGPTGEVKLQFEKQFMVFRNLAGHTPNGSDPFSDPNGGSF